MTVDISIDDRFETIPIITIIIIIIIIIVQSMNCEWTMPVYFYVDHSSVDEYCLCLYLSVSWVSPPPISRSQKSDVTIRGFIPLGNL